ncbi:hypothetical protein P152DRAFT_371879, partial [Eremomyces bilateralis CBS 781.70]
PLPFELTDLDQKILSQTDEEYQPLSWDEVKRIAAENRLELFTRTPSQLRRYLTWSRRIRIEYGGMLNYICTERLQWDIADGGVACVNPVPFADERDYTIRLNDWPYGVSPEIRHLLVWLKTPLAVDLEGKLTRESWDSIDHFVRRTFRVKLEADGHELPASERVLWFKNWTALQSVRALEHFHVMVRGVTDELIKEWT